MIQLKSVIKVRLANFRLPLFLTPLMRSKLRSLAKQPPFLFPFFTPRPCSFLWSGLVLRSNPFRGEKGKEATPL